MEYPLPSNEFPPQDWPGWLPLTPSEGHQAIEPTTTIGHSQLQPLLSHDQYAHLHGSAIDAGDIPTAHYGDDFASGETSLPSYLTATQQATHPQPLLVPDKAEVQIMAPPTNPRKRKAPTLRIDDWDPVKARVIELHIDQKLPLYEVKNTIEKEFTGFTATLVQSNYM
jgi:hypothetical protein